ncbi:hypothetical protein [Acetohalobium arabaticum]|nr:hypothetical protein [Acetohalobium arabaticum]
MLKKKEAKRELAQEKQETAQLQAKLKKIEQNIRDLKEKKRSY